MLAGRLSVLRPKLGLLDGMLHLRMELADLTSSRNASTLLLQVGGAGAGAAGRGPPRTVGGPAAGGCSTTPGCGCLLAHWLLATALSLLAPRLPPPQARPELPLLQVQDDLDSLLPLLQVAGRVCLM